MKFRIGASSSTTRMTSFSTLVFTFGICEAPSQVRWIANDNTVLFAQQLLAVQALAGVDVKGFHSLKVGKSANSPTGVLVIAPLAPPTVFFSKNASAGPHRSAGLWRSGVR